MVYGTWYMVYVYVHVHVNVYVTVYVIEYAREYVYVSFICSSATTRYVYQISSTRRSFEDKETSWKI